MESSLFAQAALPGLHLRCKLLAIVFGLATAMLLLGEISVRLQHGAAGVPGMVAPFALLLAIQQYGLAQFVRRRMQQQRDVPHALWLASSLFEITMVTGGIIVIAANLARPIYALDAPALLVYTIFVIFSTLRLDPRTSLLTGAAAGVQYFAVVMVLLSTTPDRSSLPFLVGAVFPYIMKALLLLAGGVGAAFVARELRERLERTIASQRERDRMEATDNAKSVFLAHLSHEIRAPLNAIVGYTQLLKQDLSLSPGQRHYVTTMEASGGHLLSVINQVLDLSRIEAGRQDLSVRAFDLSELLRELSVMFEFRCRQKGLSWMLRADTGMPDRRMRLGDPDRLRQVLINVLDNAALLTDAGAVELEVTRDGDHFSFRVIDNGPGIPHELREAIFQPFRQLPTRAAGGAGLGLAIARAQAELMGGSLMLDASHRAPGSRFILTIALPAAPAERPTAFDASVRLAAGCTVSAVVLDRTEVDRDVLAALLEQLGVEVRRAADADHVGRLLTERNVDLLFINISLHDGDGSALLTHLAGNKALPARIVAVSASALEHERRAFLAAGYHAFIAKPVRTADLLSSLDGLPGARFESHGETARARARAATADRDGAVARPRPLPRSLWLRLRTSADECNITDLRRGLEELAALGESAAPLCDELNALSRAYDMERIVRVLEDVPHV